MFLYKQSTCYAVTMLIDANPDTEEKLTIPFEIMRSLQCNSRPWFDNKQKVVMTLSVFYIGLYGFLLLNAPHFLSKSEAVYKRL